MGNLVDANYTPEHADLSGHREFVECAMPAVVSKRGGQRRRCQLGNDGTPWAEQPRHLQLAVR